MTEAGARRYRLVAVGVFAIIALSLVLASRAVPLNSAKTVPQPPTAPPAAVAAPTAAEPAPAVSPPPLEDPRASQHGAGESDSGGSSSARAEVNADAPVDPYDGQAESPDNSSSGTGTTTTAGMRVEIPEIDVDARVIPVGLKEDGAMETPDFGLAGWYEPGPRPGEEGPAVIVAHVDSKTGPDVFYRLRELDRGDTIQVRQGGGTETFTVERTEQELKEELPTERIWNVDGRPVLRLITCGGEFDRSSGHYRSNVIVYAS